MFNQLIQSDKSWDVILAQRLADLNILLITLLSHEQPVLNEFLDFLLSNHLGTVCIVPGCDTDENTPNPRKVDSNELSLSLSLFCRDLVASL